VTGRIQSFATLGLMSVLAAGFGLWSAFSGPKIADVQLHDAAANTLAASGFIETFQSSATATISSSAPTTTIDYQAPDRFVVVESYEVNGSKARTELRITQIGSACWEEPAAENPGSPSVQVVCAPTGGSEFLSVLRDLERTSNVTLRGGVYTLDQKDSPRFVNDILGPFGTILKGQAIEVRTDGSYVSWLYFAFTEASDPSNGSPGLYVVIRFADVGSAPNVVRPAGEPTPTATTAAALPTSTSTTLAG
jgi:hypothetical protein